MSSRALAASALLAAAVAPSATASAREGVVARVLTPISRDAAPGSRVTVAWTLSYFEAGKRRPYGPGYVFVRLVGPGGSRTPLAYGVHLLRPGGYRARVKVPQGGVSRVEIGTMGSVCDGSGCRRAVKLFRITGRVFR